MTKMNLMGCYGCILGLYVVIYFNSQFNESVPIRFQFSDPLGPVGNTLGTTSLNEDIQLACQHFKTTYSGSTKAQKQRLKIPQYLQEKLGESWRSKSLRRMITCQHLLSVFIYQDFLRYHVVRPLAAHYRVKLLHHRVVEILRLLQYYQVNVLVPDYQTSR